MKKISYKLTPDWFNFGRLKERKFDNELIDELFGGFTYFSIENIIDSYIEIESINIPASVAYGYFAPMGGATSYWIEVTKTGIQGSPTGTEAQKQLFSGSLLSKIQDRLQFNLKKLENTMEYIGNGFYMPHFDYLNAIGDDCYIVEAFCITNPGELKYCYDCTYTSGTGGGGTSESIEIVAPNRNSVITPGNISHITWETGSTISNDPVTLRYRKTEPAGNPWINIVTSYIPPTMPKSYTWQTPQDILGDAHLMIKNEVTLEQDISETFTFEQGGTSGPNPPPGGILVTSPNAETILLYGQSAGVSWSVDPVSIGGKFKIYFSSNGILPNLDDWDVIAEDYIDPNAGHQSFRLFEGWIVPTIASDNCYICVENLSTHKRDTNDGPFKIIDPQITLLTPNGGENIRAGSKHPINWTHNYYSKNFDLYYSVDNGISWGSIMEGVTENFFEWIVPEEYTNEALIKVKFNQGTGLSAFDVSNNVFSIVSGSGGGGSGGFDINWPAVTSYIICECEKDDALFEKYVYENGIIKHEIFESHLLTWFEKKYFE